MKSNLRNDDAYRPISVPRALKLIESKSKQEVNEMSELAKAVPTDTVLIKNRIVDIYISCENEKRASDWYFNVLGLPDLVMENGIRLLLMEWGENHKPINETAVFSLQASDIHQAHAILKSKGAKVDEQVGQYGAQSFGFHVIDSEGNAILIIDQAS